MYINAIHHLFDFCCLQKNGFEYIKEENADIIALQEVKCDNAKLPNEVKLTGYERYFVDSKCFVFKQLY